MIFGGMITKIAVGVAVVAAGWGGFNQIRTSQMALKLERAETATAVAQGSLLNCSLRLTNLQEAAESNASIPDDLTDFDIPLDWMLGPHEADPATD